MKKRTLVMILSVLSVMACSCIVFCYYLMSHPFRSAHLIYVDADDTVDSVYVKLEKNLQPSCLTGLKWMVALKGYSVRTGAYRLGPEVSSLTAYRTLANGHQTPVNLVIPSVRTLEQLARTVSRQIMADSANIASLLNDSAFCAGLGYTSETLPALFIPNTYQVYWNMSPKSLMERMRKEHMRYWTEERRMKAQKLGLTEIEVSTLASIVEEETAVNAEKPMVAGLYLNRLKKGMPLQADPTIKFALREFGLKRILYKHLEVESPYNTYKYPGLPPGPIRIPSISGLESVLNPASHGFLYMCAKEDFSGTHNFAVTLSQHAVNAHRYQAALNKWQRTHK